MTTKKKEKKLTQRERKWLEEYRADMRKFRYERKKERLATTQLYQRQAFIESLRRGESWKEAMTNSGIEDIATAALVYQKNTRPVTRRSLVEPEKVR